METARLIGKFVEALCFLGVEWFLVCAVGVILWETGGLCLGVAWAKLTDFLVDNAEELADFWADFLHSLE